jgi:hypothetical protein
VAPPFLQRAQELGLQFDEFFPGHFASSQEHDAADCEARSFYLTAYAGGSPWGRSVNHCQHSLLEMFALPLLRGWLYRQHYKNQ